MSTEAVVRKRGFVAAGSNLDRTRKVVIHLNGEDVTQGCQCADDVFGFIIRFTSRPAVFDPEIGTAKREMLFGNVEIFVSEKEEEITVHG